MLKNKVNLVKRNSLKQRFIQTIVVSAGLIGLSGIVNSAGLYFRDDDGNLTDLTSDNVKETFTAGESLVTGNVCYLKSDGKYWKAKGDASATIKGKIVMCTATISANATGLFLVRGNYVTSGLTTGSIYFISTSTSGAIVTTTPTTGNFIRVIGVAKSTTILDFDSSKDYGEVD